MSNGTPHHEQICGGFGDHDMNPFRIKGDMNCDGSVDSEDIDPFFLALTYPDDYLEEHVCCRVLNGDLNCDDALDSEDIDLFYTCLFGGGCDCP